MSPKPLRCKMLIRWGKLLCLIDFLRGTEKINQRTDEYRISNKEY